MTFSAPMSNFRTFQILKNEKSNLRTFSGLFRTSGNCAQHIARFLAAVTPHSGNWLLALPISRCGLKLSDNTVCVAFALHLGCSVCVTHTCHCGSQGNTHGLHGLVCKQAPSRITRHHAINNVIAWSLTTAGVPVTKEPCSWTITDGRNPEGLTLTPWQARKPVCWWSG